MNYFDCHADTLTEIPSSENLMHNSCCLDLARVRQFADHYTQIFAIWKDQEAVLPSSVTAEEAFFEAYQNSMRLMLEQSAYLKWCQNAADMQQAHAQGKAAVFLSVEDVSAMGSLVGQMRGLGFRFAMLTWNYENTYGCGAVTNQSKGLTTEGLKLASQLLDQQVTLDISHLSDQGVEDLFQLTDRPVIASHSNVREVFRHPRNLQKAHIQELIRRKGLLGVNFYQAFVARRPKLSDLLKHMDAVLQMGGEDILALGGDLDGCKNQLVLGLKGVQSIPDLKAAMEREGFGSSIIDKIFWKNAEQFLLLNVN